MFENKTKAELSISEQEHRENLRVLFSGVIVCAVFVWVLRFALGGLVDLVVPRLNNYYLTTTAALLADGISILLPFVVFHKFRRDPFRPIFTEKTRSEHPALRCVIGVVAMFCLTICGMALTDYVLGILSSHGVHSYITRPDFGTSSVQTVYYVVLSVLIYSFAYEVAFRGIALRAMREENRAAAVFVSGFAFALSDGEPHHVVVRLAVGFLIGWFYLRVRSVWACMVLHGASQLAICVSWLRPTISDPLFESFLLLAGLVLGLGAAFFLFLPKRKEEEAQITSNKLSFRIILTSFGIWLITALVAFNMMSFTFHMEDKPDLETPEHGRQDPLFNNPTDRQENIPNYQEFPDD